MRSLIQLADEASALPMSDEDRDWLHLLLSDWQVLADLAAADLVLWLPTTDGRWVAVAHCRPATSSTIHLDDIIGLPLPDMRADEVRRAYETREVVRSQGARWAGTYSMMETCVPVVREGRSIAVMTREANISAPRLTQDTGGWTVQVADQLCRMITHGEYPYEASPADPARGVPRVQDGIILIDADGVVQQLSPNAVSCLRRLGIRHRVKGHVLVEEITSVVADQTMIEETMAVVVMGRASWRIEIEAHASTVAMRALPLTEGNDRLGAVILTRDISEVARREQELMTKDATIREIHHRVKNNLQTVSALLRLQGRRSASEEVTEALGEAERRVQAIATVHAALSQNVDEIVEFDDVARSVLRMSGTVATTDHSVNVLIKGKFGPIGADQASALATVLNELVTNSVEHGLEGRDGTVQVVADRTDEELAIEVIDDGVGFATGSPGSGLGTQIVRQMVRGELHGTIEWDHGEDGGTVVTIRMPVGDDVVD